MNYIVLSLTTLLIGILLYIKERNSFLNGIILSLGIFLTTITFAVQLFSFLTKQLKYANYIENFITAIILLLIMAVFLVLIYSTILMLKKEGRGYTAFMAVGLAGNLIFIFLYEFFITQFYIYKVPNLIITTFILFWVFDLFLTILFILYLIYSVLHQLKKFKKKVDYIIILGAGIRSEEVTPLLKSRLDKGVEYYQKNPEAKFVVSGGQGPDEPVSEAFAMAKYLYSIGVPESNVILEDKSTTTYENMLFSKEKIEALAKESYADKNIIFSTNNYHVFRASVYAKKAGLKVHGVGAPTAHFFLPSALIREFIALLFMHKKLTYTILGLAVLSVLISFLPF